MINSDHNKKVDERPTQDRLPPDIEVEQIPAEMIEDHDPQLEKVIQVVFEELEKNLPRRPQRTLRSRRPKRFLGSRLLAINRNLVRY